MSEVDKYYPNIDDAAEPLTKWGKFETISAADHGADEELEDALQADILKNENERERGEEAKYSDETETSELIPGYYKKFKAEDSSSSSGKYPLSPFTQSLRKWTNVTPTFGSTWFRPAAPKSAPSFKLCIARISNSKAVARSVQEPSHKEFMHVVGMYLYNIRRPDWTLKIFVNHEAYERNQFHILARDQEVGSRISTFTNLIRPFLKSGEFCYVGIYYPEISVYRGTFPVTKYTPHEDPEHLTFQGPDGSEQDIIDFAKVVCKLTSVDPQTSADGVIIGTGHYRPEENNRYCLWNSALSHDDWVKQIFNEIDTKDVYVFLPDEIPDFELYEMSPYDAVDDIEDDAKVSTRTHDYSESSSTPSGPKYLRQTLPTFEKKKGSVRWDRAHEWYEARRKTELAKAKKAYEGVKKVPGIPKSSLPYDGMKGKLSGLRNDLQDIEGENAKNRFIAQQLEINEKWQRLRNARLSPERVYSAGGKIGVPVYGNSIEEAITGGPKLPTTYARILTAAEVEELQNRLTRVENELLMREEFCRVCEQNFTYGFSTQDVKEHYAEHRHALTVCERKHQLLAPPSSEEYEGEEETGTSNSLPMDGISKSASWEEDVDDEEPAFSLYPDKQYEVEMLTGVINFEESDSESDGEPVVRRSSDFVLNPEIWRATPNASPEIPPIRLLKPTNYGDDVVSGRKRSRAFVESDEDEESEHKSGERPGEEDGTFDPSTTKESESEEDGEEGFPEDDTTETKPSEPKRKNVKTEKKLTIGKKVKGEKRERKDSDGEFVAGDDEEDEEDEDNGLPTPGVDEPVVVEEEELIGVKVMKKGKKAKGKTGKTEEKGDGVFKLEKGAGKDDDDAVEIDGEAGARGNQGKKKYCPVDGKSLHNFGKQKLKAHLKACKIKEEDIVWATKEEASLMKEKLELEGGMSGKDKTEGRGKGKK